jgi:hypothetical protein
MLCDIEVQDTPTVVTDDEKTTSNQIVGVDAWKSVLFLRARIVWKRIFTKF